MTILAILLLGMALVDAIMRTHEQQNAVLRAAFEDIDARRRQQ